MMPQVNYQDTATHEEPVAAYGGYEGSQEYAQPREVATYGQDGQRKTYDADFIESVAQRIAERLREEQGEKVLPTTQNTVTPMMRLVIAFVSIAVLIPLAWVLFAIMPGVPAVVAFGCACLVLITVNAVFGPSSPAQNAK